MGYTVTVRKQKNIAIAMERANRVLKELQDLLLKCKLAVLCYGECYDEELEDMARRLIEDNFVILSEAKDMTLNGKYRVCQCKMVAS